MGSPHQPPIEPEVLEAILDKLAEGMPLTEICRLPGMPHVRRVYRRRDSDEEFAKELQIARDIGEEAQAVKIIEIADEKPGKGFGGGVDGPEVQNRKLRIWARTQAMDRFNPRRRAERNDDPNAAITEMLAQLAGKLPG